jgi:hypothetical protein
VDDPVKGLAIAFIEDSSVLRQEMEIYEVLSVLLDLCFDLIESSDLERKPVPLLLGFLNILIKLLLLLRDKLHLLVFWRTPLLHAFLLHKKPLT